MRSLLLASLLTLAAAHPLADNTIVARADYTENDLVSGPCRPITLIYARGTSQPGNIGNDVGPSLMSKVAKKVGDKNLARQGVDYPASWGAWVAGGDTLAMTEAMTLVRNGVKKCPKTRFVLVGHSQGTQVIEGGVRRMFASEAKKVDAVVLFGAPPNVHDPFPQIPASKVKVICHKGDSICEGSLFPNDKHEGYVKDTDTAAAFIASKV